MAGLQMRPFDTPMEIGILEFAAKLAANSLGRLEDNGSQSLPLVQNGRQPSDRKVASAFLVVDTMVLNFGW
ncbi:predicted protein [Pyrenophora tritici-repentis Pt-1C-BFP]|uniref:Uncharacterized protein n=1 Tax=Pyrenophora tritici-repentis (strain Pt-1C-BFP) TaxID=426418 RepID=B2VS40_PYRTR|nr:uncharacterized protein PTRG_00615 [Pyrenophora tritici-repentis Pt-1C-BFP]EDU40053.1 predicted protein [Pyrenophora tritici-repentis Pt-1C-BFP]